MDNLLTIKDLSRLEIMNLLSLTKDLKEEIPSVEQREILFGKSLGMIFAKASTRTRVSFEVGIYQLGGQGIFLSSNDIQLRRGESIADTAKTLSRYLDGIMIRTYNQEDVSELAKYGSIPIINGLTDLYHPCQILADLFTIQEAGKKLEDIKLTYIGDGNNIAHSLLLAAAKVGFEINVASPKNYQPKDKIVTKAEKIATNTGAKIKILTDPKQAAKKADVIYTDVWASMGDESEAEERMKAFADYQVNQNLLDVAQNDVIFLHCLPAHRGEEVAAKVIDGQNSIVFNQAENRLHLQKAVLANLMS